MMSHVKMLVSSRPRIKVFTHGTWLWFNTP